MLPESANIQAMEICVIVVERIIDVFFMQEFALLLVDVPLNIMGTYFFPCASPRVGAWLLIHPTTLAFHLFSTHFRTTLHIRFILSHLMVDHLSQCQCGHAIENSGTHLLCALVGVNLQQPMIHFEILSQLLPWKMEQCLERGFLPFPSSHPMSNGYPYHQRQLSDPD